MSRSLSLAPSHCYIYSKFFTKMVVKDVRQLTVSIKHIQISSNWDSLSSVHR